MLLTHVFGINVTKAHSGFYSSPRLYAYARTEDPLYSFTFYA